MDDIASVVATGPPSIWPSWAHAGRYAGQVGLATTAFSIPFLQSYFSQALSNGVLGGIISTFRKIWKWATDRLGFSLFITGTFAEGDAAYEWIMHYLIQENIWRGSTDFKVAAKNTPKQWGVRAGFLPFHIEENADYMPTWNRPQLFRWNGYWVEVKGDESLSEFQRGIYNKSAALKIRIYTTQFSVLAEFVEDAQKRYMELKNAHVVIHLADMSRFGGTVVWNDMKRKARRPIDTVVLEEGVLDDLVADMREFMDTEDWYIEAGIPHRRGYLLHGPPGTGKSTTIYSLAGELGLEIYSLSLSSNYIDDAMLQRAASSIPKDSILLIEDIDCAFPSREDEEKEQNMDPGFINMLKPNRRQSAVTMSGLLNILDGVGSDEGKLFFATTNYVDRLDAALMRPGRIDKKVEYHLSTRRQAHDLFYRFFSVKRFGHIQPKAEVGQALRRSSVNGWTGEAGTSEKTKKWSTESDEKPILSPKSYLDSLADGFADAVPEYTFTTAEMQGYLLLHKRDPISASINVGEWVENELRERNEKKEKEEKRLEKVRASKASRGKGGLPIISTDPEKGSEVAEMII